MERIVHIQTGEKVIEGALRIPPEAKGIVVFCHGSGSSRFSSRNMYVAEHLYKAQLATLLVDLLTPEEDAIYENRFDIDLLTNRLIDIVSYLQQEPETEHLQIGFFGASTGAAAALRAAADLKNDIKAVVSRGGRPDLAEDALDGVLAPTLLLVGSKDLDVLKLNQMALDRITCEKMLVVVPGATHLFEEPGTLEKVAEHAEKWFKDYIV